MDDLRFRVYNDANNDILFNTDPLPLATTAFTIPDGLLVPGVPYVFSVNLGDATENVSTAFTQSDYFTVPPDLLVASRANGRVLRYDGTTGAYVGDFVSAGSGGLESPIGLTFGPDGNLYVANGYKPDGTSPSTNGVFRYDGTSGAFIDVFSFGLHVTAHPDHFRTRW